MKPRIRRKAEIRASLRWFERPVNREAIPVAWDRHSEAEPTRNQGAIA